jgi:transposase
VTATGTLTLMPAQLSMRLEGIDWRHPERTFTPRLAC